MILTKNPVRHHQMTEDSNKVPLSVLQSASVGQDQAKANVLLVELNVVRNHVKVNTKRVIIASSAHKDDLHDFNGLFVVN